MPQNSRQSSIFLILTEEIIVDIFLRLPVKTLLLLKCVCKQWHTLISSSWFISLHLKRLSSHPEDHYILVVSRQTSGLISIQNPSYLVKLIQPYDYYYSVIGSINGLVCVIMDITRGYLCNPLTKQFKLLPLPDLKLRWTPQCRVTMGFGYEPNSEDYKVIRIQHHYDRCQLTVVEVYSTKLESWRQVEKGILDLNVTNFSCDAIVEGFTYWVSRVTDEPRKAVIASFDLRSETFCITPVPDVLVTESHSFVAMNYRGSFALLAFRSHSEFKNCLEVWVIEGGSCGEGLFQKKFTFGMGFDISRHWGLTNEDIVVQNYPNVPFLFNPRTKQMRIMGIHFVKSAFYYTGSLVSIKGFKLAPLSMQ